MKSQSEVRLSILKKAEEADSYLKFQEFSVHPQGGFEDEKTPGWSNEEAYEILQLIRRGYLEVSETKGDEPWLNDPTPDAVHKETYVFLTPSGHDFLEYAARGWLRRQVDALAQNVLTIAVAVVIAVASASALQFLGLSE